MYKNTLYILMAQKVTYRKQQKHDETHRHYTVDKLHLYSGNEDI